MVSTVQGGQLEAARQRFRKQLLDVTSDASRQLAAQYDRSRAALTKQIDALVTEMITKETDSASDLFRLNRYRSLLAQIDEQRARLGKEIEPIVTDAQTAMVRQAVDEQRAMAILGAAETSPALANAVAAAWSRLPVSAMEELLGSLSDGSPIAAWLDDQYPDGARLLRPVLGNGLAQGLHPRVIGDQLIATLNSQFIPDYKVQTLARTAILDSYRSASLKQMEANADILDGWVWQSAHDSRSCGACLAMDDGEIHPVTETFMGSHANCRCNPRPVVSGTDPSTRQTGEQYFATLTPEQQDRTLGIAGGKAFRDGKVSLRDFVHKDTDERWGDRYRQGSLRDALARAGDTGEASGGPVDDVDPFTAAFRRIPLVDKEAAEFRPFSPERKAYIESVWDTIPEGRTLGSRYLSSGGKETITEKSLRRDAIKWYTEPNGARGYPTIRTELAGASRTGKFFKRGDAGGNHAWSIARGIADSDPINQPLYRGSFTRSKTPPDSLGVVGDTIKLPGSSSFTADKSVADGFRTGAAPGAGEHEAKLPNHETTIVVLPGAKGIPISSVANWNQAEVITSGEFEIVDVVVEQGKRKGGKAYQHTTYTVRQVSYWEPPEDPPGGW